jgi:hypothetical protein
MGLGVIFFSSPLTHVFFKEDGRMEGANSSLYHTTPHSPWFGLSTVLPESISSLLVSFLGPFRKRKQDCKGILLVWHADT